MYYWREVPLLVLVLVLSPTNSETRVFALRLGINIESPSLLNRFFSYIKPFETSITRNLRDNTMRASFFLLSFVTAVSASTYSLSAWTNADCDKPSDAFEPVAVEEDLPKPRSAKCYPLGQKMRSIKATIDPKVASIQACGNTDCTGCLTHLTYAHGKCRNGDRNTPTFQSYWIGESSQHRLFNVT